MGYVSDLLDEIQQKTELKSDARIAFELEIGQANMTRYRRMHTWPDDDNAAAMARLAGRDALEVIARIHREKANTESSRQIWDEILRRLGGIAAGFLVSVVMLAAGSAHAQPAGSGHHQVTSSDGPDIHYATLPWVHLFTALACYLLSLLGFRLVMP